MYKNKRGWIFLYRLTSIILATPFVLSILLENIASAIRQAILDLFEYLYRKAFED